MEERHKSKKSRRKSEELSAEEKFSMFKKKREDQGSGDQIVDELFKGYIASKLKSVVESDKKSKKHKVKHKDHMGQSMEEMNRLLDTEISSLLPTDERIEDTVAEEIKNGRSVEIKSESAADRLENNPSSVTDTDIKPKITSEETNNLPLRKIPEVVSTEYNSKETSSVKDKDDMGTESERHSKHSENVVKSEEGKSSAAVAGPMLPRSLAIGDTKDDKKVEVKKPLGFKNFGIKLSAMSAELIQSGAVHKKGKRLEEGEVLSDSEGSETSTSAQDATNAAAEEEDDDDSDIDKLSETGSIKDSDTDSKSKSRKKKKKKKEKKKKKHKSKERELEEDKEKTSSKRKRSAERSVSPKRSHRSRSGSNDKKDSKHKSVSRNKTPDKKVSKSRSQKSRSRSRGRKSGHRKGQSRSRSKSKERHHRKKSAEKSRKRSRSRNRSRNRSRSRNRNRSRSKNRNRSRSKNRNRSRSRNKNRSRSRNRSRSKNRNRSRSRNRSASRVKKRSRSRSPKRSRSKSPKRKSAYGEFDAYQFTRGRRRSRSRSRSRSPSGKKPKHTKELKDLRCKIDKAKLREIAIKNALSHAQAGNNPLAVTIKAGGKSVEELTEYCKKIAEKEDLKRKERNYFSDSSDEESVGKASDDELTFHPFVVKEPAPITMDIKNAKQLPTVTPLERLVQQSTVLRTQFPVSSGSDHRNKESEWVPVEPPQPTSLKPGTYLQLPAPPPPPPPEKPSDKVYEETSTLPVDIGAIVSQRLSAVRKLQENPNDMSAKAVLSAAQKQASQWAQSKHLPGQFIGSTGASIMSQEQLIGDKRRQAWLKKDVFTNAAPVTGGIGMYLLQKMGWKHGEGLGKNNEGTREPIMLDFKIDRRGLLTEGEGKKSNTVAPVKTVKDLSGKHPVSALGEFCNKRRWGAPTYELVHESGPAHRKDFLYKVIINNIAYQPSIANTTKKVAKAQAATAALQQLGLVPMS